MRSQQSSTNVSHLHLECQIDQIRNSNEDTLNLREQAATGGQFIKMSGYNGRRAPNLSQFLEDLNTIPSPFEQAVQQQQQQQESFNLDEELAMFTNAEFLDFDNLDMNIPLYDPEDSQNHGDKAGVGKEQDVKYMDLLNGE